jgi:chromosome segregation ATPase
MSKITIDPRTVTALSIEASTAPDSSVAQLGPAVTAEVTALQADLEEANRLSAAYQHQLAGKNDELARLTELFEKTRRHLIQLQLSVTDLRDERHRLSNRAMESDALQRKLMQVTLERDRLRQELLSREKWAG